MFNKLVISLAIIAFIVLYTLPPVVYSNDLSSSEFVCTGTEQTWNQSIVPTSPSIQLTWPTSLEVHTHYYAVSGYEVVVSTIACYENADTANFLSFALATGADGVGLTVSLLSNQSNAGNSGKNAYPSSALKGYSVNTSLTLLAIVITSLFVLPKNRWSILILFGVICVAFLAPSIKASSTTTLIVSIGIPNSITEICENGECNSWNGSGSSETTSTAGSTTATTATTGGSTTATTATTATTGGSTTGSSTTTGSSSFVPPAGSVNFNLRVCILSASISVTGVDFVQLAFDSIGMPYDFVTVTSTTDLSQVLTTSGTGPYSGIVAVYSTGSVFSEVQLAVINKYQQIYGVKWAIVGSSPSDVEGVEAGAELTGEAFNIELSPEFAQYAACIQPSVSIANDYTINWSGYTYATVITVTITDTSSITPVLLINTGSGTPQPGVIAVASSDGTQQLYYFLEQAADYIHSRVFAPVLVNWISPAGIFIGARRLTFSVQADDLFLASFIWNTTTHTNPLTTYYRMSADDLQFHADFYNQLNPQLPSGSHVTVEWPTNGGGVNVYVDPDELYFKALEIQDNFYFLSHTWDHPCTLDTATYAFMVPELTENIAFFETFFPGGLANPLFTNNSMVTPCITGLFNGQVLEAMWDNGIYNCVGDNSQPDLQPSFPYHGYYTTNATNNFTGIFVVPRECLDIDYDNVIPAQLVDEYNTEYNLTKTFEEIMVIERVYGIQDKVAFRHDPFMMHQANGGVFLYDDPILGVTHNCSLISLWTSRVIAEMLTYYNLPIISPNMMSLVSIWKQRLEMDTCGITVTLTTENGQVIGLETTSQSSCELSLSGVTLSGPTVTVETVGVETTSWIDLTANTAQSFGLSTPKNL